MEIQLFEEKYRAQVIQLWTDCELVKPWNDPGKDIDRKLKVDPDLFLIGLENGKVVGSVMGGYEGHRGWINYLAVAPFAQRSGYGRQLMQMVEEKIQAKGCPKINLQVREENHAILAFYQSLGYGNDQVIGMGKRLIPDQ